jgi:hypothetical protein
VKSSSNLSPCGILLVNVTTAIVGYQRTFK